ncbi:MAG: MFS transporter [candidate division NC10 bacterium]|nr:MFS transporter [candidate division NC10 bacterium]
MEPEGVARYRRARWGIWAVAAAVFFVSYFHRVAPAVVAKDLMAEFRTTGAILGVLVAGYLHVYAVMQIPAGLLADVVGPRGTLLAGAVGMALGSALFAAAPNLPLAYAGRFLTGLGASVIFVCLMKVVANWFRPREFATLSGLSVTVGNLAAVVAATPLALLAAAIGWRGSFFLVAALTALLAGLTWRFVYARPEDIGIPSPALFEGSGVRPAAPAARVGEGLRIVLANRHTWPAFFVFFGLYSTLITFVGLWGVPYLRDVYGMPTTRAANLMALTSAGLLVGGPLAGLLSDRLLARRRLPYLGFSLAYGLLWGLLAFSPGTRPPEAWLPALAFSLGFASAGLVLTWVCATEVNPPHYAGLATATVNTGGFLGAAVLQVLLGAVLDARWAGAMEGGARVYSPEAYGMAFTVCFGVAAAAALLAGLVTETHGRNVWERLRRTAA